MAASVLRTAESKVRFAPERLEDIGQAITKADIRGLVGKGFITIRRWAGQSRARARHIAKQKKKGKRSGRGSVGGRKGARLRAKRTWIVKIRSLRRELKRLRDEGKIGVRDYRLLYHLTKGNAIRNKAHLMLYLKETHMLKGEESGKAKKGR